MTVLHDALETPIGMGFNNIQERQEIRRTMIRFIREINLQMATSDYVDDDIFDLARLLKDQLGISD